MYKGKKVRLRAYTEYDIKTAHEFINDYEVKQFLDSEIPFPITLWEEEQWVKQSKGKDLTYDFAIEDLQTEEFIGGCSINSASKKNRNCTIGIMIGDKKYWGKGYGYDALSVLIKFIFEECNLEKIKLEVFSFNKRAIACYKKLGFNEEGILKRELYRHGEYNDIILMALFKDDYFKGNNQIKI